MTNEQQTNHPGRRGLMVLALILCCTTAISVVYLLHERGILRAMGTDRDQVNLELTQARSQIRTLTEQVDALSAPPAAPVALAPPSSTVKKRHTAASKKVSKPPAEDKRLSQMQNQLAEQQKELASTREDIQKTHDDLQNKLDSTGKYSDTDIVFPCEKAADGARNMATAIVTRRKLAQVILLRFFILSSNTNFDFGSQQPHARCCAVSVGSLKL